MRSSLTLAATASTLFLAACGDGGTTEPPPGEELVCTIPTNQIFAALARDAIPSLTTPEFTTVANAGFLFGEDRVLGVEINGEARAYPFGIMWWHEIVNDTLGGENILVTYCPLTGTGIAFNPNAGGILRSFGVSGLLFQTNLFMFDRESNSLWNQMLLGSQCGPDRGTDLPRIPIVETTWEDWSNRYPNTTVLTTNTGFGNRPYFEYPYGNYADENNPSVDFLAPGTTWSSALLPKELVLGVLDGNSATAYPLNGLADSAVSYVVNDVVGSTPVLVLSRAQWNTARAFDRRVNSQTLTFTLTNNPGPVTMVDAETSSEWDQEGKAISGPLAGQQLAPIEDSYTAFWFAWSIYYPNSKIFK
ncbi:MAG: DUF3179 domain-containing protein [Gemmatimonadetes bacterium]|nr:DUF3179 domain-containing protein [Gemmatimonadota bacterium]